jgi:hypothetical protein
MAKAAEGMRSEIKSTFVAYVLMIGSLAVGLLMSFWLLMDWKAATVSNIVLVYAVSMWWRYCARIYNKFYLEELLVGEHSIASSKRWTDSRQNKSDLAKEGVEMRLTISSPLPAVEVAIVNAHVPVPTQSHTIIHHSRSPEKSSPAHGAGHGEAHFRGNIAVEGYLRKQSTSGGWKRRYFVADNAGNMFYYEAKTDYLHKPTAPIKNRPISLKDYRLQLVLSSCTLILLPSDDCLTGTRTWTLQSDAEEEIMDWKEAISGFVHSTSS